MKKINPAFIFVLHHKANATLMVSETKEHACFVSHRDLNPSLLQLQEAHAAEQKKVSGEMEEVRAHMKKTQLRAEEVQGTFETHNGEYLRMKV